MPTKSEVNARIVEQLRAFLGDWAKDYSHAPRLRGQLESAVPALRWIATEDDPTTEEIKQAAEDMAEISRSMEGASIPPDLSGLLTGATDALSWAAGRNDEAAKRFSITRDKFAVRLAEQRAANGETN